MSCQCPEVHDGDEWLPHCEAGDAGSLAGAEAEGLEPRSWRCPRCGGSIVRVYLELAKIDPDNNDAFLPLEPPGTRSFERAIDADRRNAGGVSESCGS
jgi:hypothetical protein